MPALHNPFSVLFIYVSSSSPSVLPSSFPSPSLSLTPLSLLLDLKGSLAPGWKSISSFHLSIPLPSPARSLCILLPALVPRKHMRPVARSTRTQLIQSNNIYGNQAISSPLDAFLLSASWDRWNDEDLTNGQWIEHRAMMFWLSVESALARLHCSSFSSCSSCSFSAAVSPPSRLRRPRSFCLRRACALQSNKNLLTALLCCRASAAASSAHTFERQATR